MKPRLRNVRERGGKEICDFPKERKKSVVKKNPE